MTTKFIQGQKAALINLGGFGPARIIPVTVEKVTKTKLTIRYPNGMVSTNTFNIREDLAGKQEGRHAKGSYRYYKEHVEIWTESHDNMVAARNAEMATQRQLNTIKECVAKLHVSETDLSAKLAEVLKINEEHNG